MAERSTRLSVVHAGDAPKRKPARKRDATPITTAAESDDRLAELQAMRLRLARALDSPDCPPRDMAALSRRQLEIGREIESLKARAKEEGDGVDHGSTEPEEWDDSAI